MSARHRGTWARSRTGRAPRGQAPAGARAPGRRPRRARSLLEYGRTVIAAEAAAIQASPPARRELRRGGPLDPGLQGARRRHRAWGSPASWPRRSPPRSPRPVRPSLYVHPAEAAHGDLGRIAQDDVVVALSNSRRDRGAPAPPAGAQEDRRADRRRDEGPRQRRSRAAPTSSLAIGNVEEACPLGLAPTASTAVLLARGRRARHVGPAPSGRSTARSTRSSTRAGSSAAGS